MLRDTTRGEANECIRLQAYVRVALTVGIELIKSTAYTCGPSVTGPDDNAALRGPQRGEDEKLKAPSEAEYSKRKCLGARKHFNRLQLQKADLV